MDAQSTDRGQTTIDFALGASILLLGVMFVVVMAPNLFTPFEEGQAADPLTSDRLADHLVEDRLVDDPSSSDLNESKADAFFGGGDDDIDDDLQPSQYRDLNVTLVRMETGSVEKQRGPDLPSDSGQVTKSQRVVVYDDEPHWLYVRVW